MALGQVPDTTLLYLEKKNAVVTRSAKQLKCKPYTVKKMTKVPQGVDLSFLNEEEARKILQVLERNEELQRAEKDRIRYRTNSFLLSPGPGCRRVPGPTDALERVVRARAAL